MTDRPPPEPVPPRALHVPPFLGEEFDALVRQLDVSDAAGAVLDRLGSQVGPGRLANLLARSPERAERALCRMADQLDRGGG